MNKSKRANRQAARNTSGNMRQTSKRRMAKGNKERDA